MSRTKPKSLKSNKKYKDAPRYKAIYGYEDDFKNSFSKIMIGAQKELILKMKNMSPKK